MPVLKLIFLLQWAAQMPECYLICISFLKADFFFVTIYENWVVLVWRNIVKHKNYRNFFPA
jgi:hypothetical protein